MRLRGFRGHRVPGTCKKCAWALVLSRGRDVSSRWIANAIIAIIRDGGVSARTRVHG